MACGEVRELKQSSVIDASVMNHLPPSSLSVLPTSYCCRRSCYSEL